MRVRVVVWVRVRVVVRVRVSVSPTLMTRALDGCLYTSLLCGR